MEDSPKRAPNDQGVAVAGGKTGGTGTTDGSEGGDVGQLWVLYHMLLY